MDAPETDATDRAEALLERLAETGDRKDLMRLGAMGRSALPALRRGLEHESWKVRRDCLRIFDHILDAESGRLVLARLDDPHPDVRKWVAHALGCDHCKTDPALDFDPVPRLMDVARGDPSLRVRRSAVVSLAWTQSPQRRIAEFLGELLASATDAKIRMHAESGAERHAAGARDV